MNILRIKAETDEDDNLLTVAEVARAFGRTRQAIHNWNKDGRFPNSIVVGDKKTVLIPASDVEAVKKSEAEKLLIQLNRLGFQAVAA